VCERERERERTRNKQSMAMCAHARESEVELLSQIDGHAAALTRKGSDITRLVCHPTYSLDMQRWDGGTWHDAVTSVVTKMRLALSTESVVSVPQEGVERKKQSKRSDSGTLLAIYSIENASMHATSVKERDTGCPWRVCVVWWWCGVGVGVGVLV